MPRVLLLTALLVATAGCGGAITTAYIIQGQLALAGAKAANAENLATYEYVSAEAYLAKAREAHSYADYEHSLRFARIATERAQKARKKALDANKPLTPSGPTRTEGQPAPEEPAPAAPAPQPTEPAPAPQAQPAPSSTQPPPQDSGTPARRPPIIIKRTPEAQPSPEPSPTPAPGTPR
ncbi:MAG: DUF4398 domain-containing protein [Myxococcota bacterium]